MYGKNVRVDITVELNSCKLKNCILQKVVKGCQ